jgi:hypothetical protein
MGGLLRAIFRAYGTSVITENISVFIRYKGALSVTVVALEVTEKYVVSVYGTHRIGGSGCSIWYFRSLPTRLVIC